MSFPRRFPVTIPVIALAVVLAGCGIGDDGPQTTQTRDLAGFTRIENDDSVHVRVHVGNRQRVRVRAGEEVIDDVRTEVRDGTLQVTFDRDGFGTGDVVVEASVPVLTGLEASGSGDLRADGIAADAFAVRSDGSADIELAGRTGRLLLELDGSGDADVAGLEARDARVVVGGSGDAEVRAKRRLDVNLDGSGDVRYHGDPALDEHVDGSGELRRAD